MPVPDDPAPSAARRARIGLWAGMAVTAVAVAVAVLFGISRADDPGKIVKEVVALHDRGAEAPAPSPIPDTGPRPGFADNAAAAGWVASGARQDRIEGRPVVTIFWDRAGRRIAYSSVSGGPVSAPGDARRQGRRGVLLRSFDLAGRTAVTWDENGHTAVISAVGISRAALYNLAGGRAASAG